MGTVSTHQDGIKSEFNMSLESLRRVHNLFSYINQSGLMPDIEVTPEQKYQAYLSIYEEVHCLMSKTEREECEKEMKELVSSCDNFLNNKNQQNSGNSSPRRKILNQKIQHHGVRLGFLMMGFGIKLRQVLQAHGYLYKQSDDPKDTILE